MVNGHSVEDLTLTLGDRVVTHGRLERTQGSGHITLWVLNPWDTHRVQYFDGGCIAVTLRDEHSLPDGIVVRVTGVWNGSSIEDAAIEPSLAPKVECAPGSSTHMSPGEAGEAAFMSALEAVALAGSPILASGGSTTAAWAYVLYVTPRIAKAQEDSSVQIDIFSAVTPSSRDSAEPVSSERDASR